MLPRMRLGRRILNAIERLRGSPIERDVGIYAEALTAVKARSGHLADVTDDDLRSMADAVREKAGLRESAARRPIEGFAIAVEASRRFLGMTPFDPQIIAALAMYENRVVEMQTGEGKTLAAAMTASTRALRGHRVHVLTCNDYLAGRDASWMRPLYQFFGLRVGFIKEGMSARERRAAYDCDVTYATANESGFDFLRDSLCFEPGDQVHQPFDVAIIDEADSILIDDGRIPLVIAGRAPSQANDTRRLARLVSDLEPRAHYEVGEGSRNVHLTEDGIDRLEAVLGCGSLYRDENYQLLTELELALHAAVLLRRDVDYVVRDGEIALVDENTGRIADRRHWPQGLQAALEAKEGVDEKPDGRVLGQITIQHFVLLYPALAGMTATATDSASEFHDVYGLSVVVVPPHRPCVRVDDNDLVFRDNEARERALVDEIVGVHASSRPILIGTRSVEESTRLAEQLGEVGLACRVLNAVTETEKEAAIVAEAGAPGAITVSTNMAGRGTDIRLGGAVERYRDDIVELGGLYVIGTGRHDSRRIDHQLRGRAGRQGDPGLSRFFISLDDPLLARSGVATSPRAQHRRAASGGSDAPIDDARLLRTIDRAQRIVEGQHAEIRRTLVRYFNVLERQRREIGAWRRRVLHADQAPLLSRRCPQRWQALGSLAGREAAAEIERRLLLAEIDRAWADHLASAADVREGAHLVASVGKNPIDYFNRAIDGGFADLVERVEAAVAGELERLDPDDLDAVRRAAELRGPSATWTYLVSDDPFIHGLEAQLGRHVGFAAGAALGAGPLIFLVGLWRRIRRRSRARSTS